MKERPILFSGAMVRAILDGRKTQTRRVVKAAMPLEHAATIEARAHDADFVVEYWPEQERMMGNFGRCENIKCPYGQLGDRLWVRETHYRMGKWVKNGKTTAGRQRWRFAAEADGVVYTDNLITTANTRTTRGWHKRPAIFMPRWASRITLEITGVRVERLDEIGESDAIAESCYENCIDDVELPAPVDAFRQLWDSINAKRAPWASSPWVWVVEFKRV